MCTLDCPLPRGLSAQTKLRAWLCKLRGGLEALALEPQLVHQTSAQCLGMLGIDGLVQVPPARRGQKRAAAAAHPRGEWPCRGTR